jgi:hydroxyacylglutathione hydrolase
MNFFESYKVDEGVTCIKGLTGELMFLVEGNERAALIDTGLGVGNIKEYVDSLTSLPYIVLHSHGHLDHVGGAFLYNSIYISPKDIPILRSGSGIEPRKNYLESILVEHSVSTDDYIPVGQVECVPIRDGDLFDLGGFIIEAIAAPGHTDGSLCFLFKERRILFTGDACNGFTFLFLEGCLSIEDYQKTVQALLERADEYDRILVSHVYPEAPKSMIQEVYDCCTDIMGSNADDIPFNFMGRGTAYIAKKPDPKGGREDGKFGNIVYSKENIFTKNKEE